MFSYSTVVYGLKQSQRLQEAPQILELLSCRNNIIYEHHPENDESCGWPGLHYHGLFEYITKIGFHKDRILNQIKMHCSYFTPKNCESPPEYFILANKCKMKHVFTKICIPSDLIKHIQLSDAVQQETVADESIPRPCCFKLPRNVKCHTPILDLCKAFCVGSSLENEYLTPFDSATFVDNWCFAQNIPLKDFVNNWIYCLDSESEFTNTLYFQGVDNLCIKAILNSVVEACEPLVGKVSKGTTGYKYFWKCCLGKRMIALYEPYFDGLNSSDKMLEILEGTESRTVIDNNIYVKMQRTPIVVIAKELPSSRKLQFEMKNRLVKCYSKLKTFKQPEKKIHPAWLCLSAEKYYIPWCQRNNDGSTQPAIFPSEADNLGSPESQEEECENTSDQNSSEFSEDNSESEFMDTEEKSDNASVKSDFIGPKLVLDIPQINSLKSPDCENVNEDIPGPNKVNNHLQDTIESDVGHQSEGNASTAGLFRPELADLLSQGIDYPASSNIKVNKKKETKINEVRFQCEEESAIEGLFQHELADLPSREINSPGPSNIKNNKKKERKKSRHQVKTDENTSAVAGLFQPSLDDLPSPGINSPGPSNVKVNELADLPSQGINSSGLSNIKNNKKKETKKSRHQVKTDENTSAVAGLFQPSLDDLLSPGINSPGPSNVKVNEKKQTKNIQGAKKRSAEENFTGKEKLKRNWENGQMIHPVKKFRITFKNLMKNH